MNYYQEKSVTHRKFALFLSLMLLVIISATLLRAQSATEQDTAQAESSHEGCNWRCQQAQILEGSWDVTVTPVVPPGVPQPPSFIAHSTFARGGASIGSDRTRPFSGPQHGVWEHLGGNVFASTFTQDEFNAMGNFQGTLKVRVRFRLIGRDAYIGVANGEQRDANGNLVFSGCTTVKGVRIKVEPLPGQCQNITSPR